MRQDNSDTQEKYYENAATKLFELLDIIDTLPDAMHPSTLEDYKNYMDLVNKLAQKRHEYLDTDGYQFYLNPEKAKEKKKKTTESQKKTIKEFGHLLE